MKAKKYPFLIHRKQTSFFLSCRETRPANAIEMDRVISCPFLSPVSPSSGAFFARDAIWQVLACCYSLFFSSSLLLLQFCFKFLLLLLPKAIYRQSRKFRSRIETIDMEAICFRIDYIRSKKKRYTCIRCTTCTTRNEFQVLHMLHQR